MPSPRDKVTESKNSLELVLVQFSSVQSLSRVRLFATPLIAAHQVCLSITNSQSSLRLTSIESMMPSSHLILCSPLLLLPPIPPSIRVFSNESTLCLRWPKYWSFSFSIIPSKEIPRLISFRMDWLDLSRVFSNTTVQKHQFFDSQPSSQSSSLIHDHWKTIALTRRTSVGKVMSLLLNMLSNVIPIKLPVFHRTRINNPKIYMKPQKTQNCQGKPKEKEHSWRHNPPRLQIVLQSDSNQNSVVLAQKQTYRPME